MKRISLILVLINLACRPSAAVYVCDSSGARRFHYKPACRGLSNCTYKIKKTTLEAAQKEGKTLCHLENELK